MEAAVEDEFAAYCADRLYVIIWNVGADRNLTSKDVMNELGAAYIAKKSSAHDRSRADVVLGWMRHDRNRVERIGAAALRAAIARELPRRQRAPLERARSR